jgi:glycosyltransferase involved in cell wall biosynthesis
MKIAFFGSYGAFDYFKIGGTESFTRRLAQGLIAKGYQTDFVLYGAPVQKRGPANLRIGLYYVTTLEKAFEILKNYDQVLTIYLPPADRMRYLHFRRFNQRRLHFNQFYFSWPDSRIKRKLAFLDARLYPFNGRLFCVSPRQLEHVRQWSDRGALLLPPVPESYFKDLSATPGRDRVKVTYIGRTESGKGIEDVIKLFTLLQEHPQVDLEIHGFHHGETVHSVKIHQWLKRQKSIRYFYTPYESYSKEVEENVRIVLHGTDFLVLPYRKLSSTIDMPMLFMEGMASCCAVITRALGSIPQIYGPSPFLLPGSDNVATAAALVVAGKDILRQERERIRRHVQELGFGLGRTVTRLVGILS